MFDWVPISFYTPIYFHFLLAITLFTFLHTQIMGFNDNRNKDYLKVIGYFSLVFIILYMGLRPIHGVFVDMKTYARIFNRYQNGGLIISKKDLLFHYFMKFCSYFISARYFFFLCATLYIVPAYIISKRWFKEFWFYAFLLLVGSFTFWAFGTNGIRNGIASSFFLLALAAKKRWIQIFWLLISVNFHGSMYLPAMGLVITWFYNKPRGFYYFWLASIPLSLVMPGFWESLFASMVEDERSEYFTDDKYADSFSSIGFRWDFLLYSATGVFAGTYYIFKKKIRDEHYIRLFNLYLFANAFWILVIRASFSNRFAYLSWFLLALVIIYPWRRIYFEKKQHQKLGWVIIAYIGFTYFMNVIIKLF